jgi:hypothetical protein
MKKIEIFGINEVTTKDTKDLTKNHTVRLFDADIAEVEMNGVKVNRLKKGANLFEYEYQPILLKEDYEKLLLMFNHSSLLIELYAKLSFIYSKQYELCIKWFVEKSRIKDVFDYKKEIEDVINLKIKANCFPIIDNVKANDLDDTDVFKWIQVAIKNAQIEKVEKAEDILFQKNSKMKLKPCTNEGDIVIKKIANITYKRLINFMKLQEKKSKNDKKDKQYFELIDDISTNECHRVLINEGFIHNETKQKEFDDVFNKSSKRINWIGSKEELSRFIYYLFNDDINEQNKAVCKKIKNKFLVASEIFYVDNTKVPALSIKNGNRYLTKPKRRNALLSAVKSLRNNRKK